MQEQNQNTQPNIPGQQPTIQPEIPQKQAMPAWAIVLITVLAIAVIGGACYAAYQYYGQICCSEPEPIACTEEAKICPDGSSVGRIAPDCKFTECPEVDETVDWQTYRNEEYGFEVRYPENWRKGENSEYPYIAGQWYTAKPGMSIALCLPPNGCQDSTIRISVVEQENIDIIEKEFILDKENVEISDSEFLGYKSRTIIYNNPDSSWKIIIFEKNKMIFVLGGVIKSDVSEEEIFEELISTFKFIEAVNQEQVIYENSEFNFKLTLPKGWEKYKVYELGNTELKNIGFYLPTTDPVYKSTNATTIPGYADVFHLLVYSKSEWNKTIERCEAEWGPGCVTNKDSLATDGKYYISNTYPNGGPGDFYGGKGTGDVDINVAYLKNNIKFITE